LFLAIGLFVKNTGEPISYDTFLNNRKTAKYRKEEKEYIHELKF
jgi:hypothetical protein